MKKNLNYDIDIETLFCWHILFHDKFSREEEEGISSVVNEIVPKPHTSNHRYSTYSASDPELLCSKHQRDQSNSGLAASIPLNIMPEQINKIVSASKTNDEASMIFIHDQDQKVVVGTKR